MIEQAMIFVLGFLVSGLLTLLFLPAFWRRAMRLSRRRLEMQMPLSMAEIATERDQLRAEFATQQRRIEQRCETLVTERARDMGELGRRARQIGSLEAELADSKRKVVEQGAALDETERRIADVEGQCAAAGKELFDMTGRLARISDAAADRDRDNKALKVLTEEQRVALAVAETRVADLALRLEALERDYEAAIRTGAAKENAAQRLSEDLSFARTSAAATVGKLQGAMARIEELNGTVRELRAALEETRRVNLRLETKVETATQSLADAAEREAALRSALDDQPAALRAAEQNHARQISALHAESSALEGALQTARKQLAGLRVELAAARHGAAPLLEQEDDEDAERLAEDAMLRQTIKEIGSEVSRLVRTLEDQNPGEAAGASAGLGELMRALQGRAAGRSASSG